jgi:hypothetical protein
MRTLKLFFLFTLSLVFVQVSYSQNLSSYTGTLRFGRDFVGKEITIVDSPDEQNMFFYEIPDTIWIKKVKKPKLHKHYELSYVYKAKHQNDYWTPAKYVVGRTFIVQDAIEEENIINRKTYTLKLQDKTTGERIRMKFYDINSHYVLHLKVHCGGLYDELIGKTFVNKKSGKEVVVKDCFYEYKSQGGGWTVLCDGKQHLKLQFADNSVEYAKSCDSYLPPEEYETYKRAEALKELKRKAETGEWKIVYRNAIKPMSAKFSKGKISYNDYLNSLSYIDNHIELKLIPQEKNLSVELKNISGNTITIVWDEIIFVNEDSESQRVIHSGIKYNERNNPQQPSLIAKNTVLKDALIPVNRIKWMTDEWYVGPILNWRHTPRYYNGKQVQLIFPIKTNGVSYEYTFVFDLVWEWTYPQEREKWIQLMEGSKE